MIRTVDFLLSCLVLSFSLIPCFMMVGLRSRGNFPLGKKKKMTKTEELVGNREERNPQVREFKDAGIMEADAEKFIKAGLQFNQIKNLTDGDLQELGISMTSRISIRQQRTLSSPVPSVIQQNQNPRETVGLFFSLIRGSVGFIFSLVITILGSITGWSSYEIHHHSNIWPFQSSEWVWIGTLTGPGELLSGGICTFILNVIASLSILASVILAGWMKKLHTVNLTPSQRFQEVCLAVFITHGIGIVMLSLGVIIFEIVINTSGLGLRYEFGPMAAITIMGIAVNLVLLLMTLWLFYPLLKGFKPRPINSWFRESSYEVVEMTEH